MLYNRPVVFNFSDRWTYVASTFIAWTLKLGTAEVKGSACSIDGIERIEVHRYRSSIDQWSHVVFSLQWGTDLKLSVRIFNSVNDFAKNALVNNESARRGAALTSGAYGSEYGRS